eukprot:gnl/TRDRNA2_/TRDRNA2_129837_c0_seq1.p2 gnl/TRDRNA2_/TRDRNA2_129837_c0~~gnl/TRDRNA2_/TRDRNA2_129837_c0_seq1.p2  ORF type:complete len:148 (-),score=17.59 gnl/TRDRNA2_/TRDRNA2_129837_c0_seq1:7-450(-)
MLMSRPISYDLSFARRVPSLIRPKGIATDDPVHTDQVQRTLRVEPHATRAWLECLAWVRTVPGSAKPPPRGAVTHWEDLEDPDLAVAMLKGEVTRLTAVSLVACLEEPPSWLYAGRRFYVGDPQHCPRGYLPVDLKTALAHCGLPQS